MNRIYIATLMVLALILSGCGSSKTYNTYEENITVDEPYIVPDGMAIIVDDTSESSVTIDSGIITIDCGGTCGDITIGSPADGSLEE